MPAQKPWTSSLDFPLGIVLIVGGFVALLGWPHLTRTVALSDLPLWFGVIVLGTGLLLDLWRLLVLKVQPGEEVTSMCVESVFGVWMVVLGLACLMLPLMAHSWVWRVNMPVGALLLYVGACFVFSAWLHDLVWIKRGGRWFLMREPEHGSFILIHLRKKR
jgi:hypothetical protein